MKMPLKLHDEVGPTRVFYGWCGKHKNHTMMKITTDPEFRPEEYVKFCPLCGHLLVFSEKQEKGGIGKV